MEVMFIWKLLHGVNPVGLTLLPKATETLAPIKSSILQQPFCKATPQAP